MSRTVRVLVALVVLFVLFEPAARSLSKTVIYRLKAAAQAQYPGDTMNVYTVYVYRGKAYATTRGMVKGVSTIAVWEYVPDEWHRIFDYPSSDAQSPEVTQHYRSYGFNSIQQKHVLAAPKPFP